MRDRPPTLVAENQQNVNEDIRALGKRETDRGNRKRVLRARKSFKIHQLTHRTSAIPCAPLRKLVRESENKDSTRVEWVPEIAVPALDYVVSEPATAKIVWLSLFGPL